MKKMHEMLGQYIKYLRINTFKSV